MVDSVNLLGKFLRKGSDFQLHRRLRPTFHAFEQGFAILLLPVAGTLDRAEKTNPH